MPDATREQWESGNFRPDRSYPIITPLEYRLRERDLVLNVGHGRTKTISTSSLSFESENGLPVGMLVELEITWPARGEKAGIKLCVLGRTVELEGNVTKVDILRHEFRQPAKQRPGESNQARWRASSASAS